MTIPTFHDIMLPLLELTADQNEYSIREAVSKLAEHFNLSEEEEDELLPSGTDKLFKNRVYWARFYLTKANLLASPIRGFIKITERGLNVLNQKPEKINEKYLLQFDDFKDFIETSRGIKIVPTQKEDLETEKTLTESLEEAHKTIMGELTQNLIEQIKNCSPDFFEKLVLDLLIEMDYGGSREEAARRVGRSHDEGIDGIIKEDKLGLDLIYIQAKRWEHTVGRPEIQRFAGALEGKRAKKGIFITTSKFSSEALQYISNINKKIVLIDGQQLAKYMIDHNVGVSVADTYKIKKIDLDYFEE